jgi:hypothetical protein
MWQIMWLFSLLPDFVYHILLIVGLLAFAGSYLLKMVPFFMQNAFMIRIASMMLIIFCVWIEGGFAVEAKKRAQEVVAQLTESIANYEKAAAKFAASGNAKKSEEAAESATARRVWLAEAEKGLAEFN